MIRMPNHLTSTSKRIGQLYPILVDYYGNIIDGMHRLRADKDWKEMKLEHIRTEEDKLIAKIISNNVRRKVSSKEKSELLGRLGQIYHEKGIAPGKIAHLIEFETGMSYRWIMKYLPERFKDRSQSERRKCSVAHRATNLIPLKNPPDDVLDINVYRNTDFVDILLKKEFYKKLEEGARKLEITPATLIYSALLLALKSLC